MYTLIVFLPLVGFLIAGLFGRQIGNRASQVITSGLVLFGAVLSIYAFFEVAIGGAAPILAFNLSLANILRKAIAYTVPNAEYLAARSS